MGVGLALATVVLAAMTATLAASEPEGPDGAEGPSVPELVSPAAEAVALTWEAPEGCPDVDAVRQALVGYLGTGPSAEAGAAVRAEARVSRSGGEYRLVLRTETASGTSVRETTATDCTVIVDATAVIVAIAVDPATVLARGDVAPKLAVPDEVEPSEPEPDEAAPSEVESEPGAPGDPGEPAPFVEPTPVPVPAPAPAPRVRFGVRVGGGVDFGVLPKLAGGLRLAGVVLGRAWRAELRGDFWFPRTAIVAEGIGGRVSVWSVGARGCGVPRVERVGLEFPLCAGLESGAMRGEPVGARVTSPTPGQRLWLAADGSAGVAWAPRRFIAFVVQAELVVPLLRTGFRVGEREVHVTSPAAVRGLVGVEVRFP